MKRLAVIFAGCLAAATAIAQTTAISRSGQFVIVGIEPGAPRTFVPEVARDPSLVGLEPALLAVSCERIKQALLSALTIPDQWRGRVRIALHPARSANEQIVVSTARFNDIWNYQVSLPDSIEPARLVRAVTQMLLVELANRQQPARSATLPAWLAEGMPQYLIATTDMELVLKPAPVPSGNGLQQRSETREIRRTSSFSKARERLRQRHPLTIEQLSHPVSGQLDGEAGEIYRDNALLFINELLQLRNGGACLAAMLPELPWDPDWRVGFLKAFQPHFKRLMDFEKWWALQSAYFAGRDPNQTWPRAESLIKLDEILRTPFEVRLGSNEPALYTDVSLQAVIKGWNLERQSPVLWEKISLLDNLQLRVAPELKPVVQQYRTVLATYLDKMGSPRPAQKPAGSGRHSAGRRSKEAGAPAADNPTLQSTIAQLDVLDARCAAWKATHD